MPSKSACPRPLCGGVHACAFSLLAEDMKYSSRDWLLRPERADRAELLHSILEELSLSLPPSALYKTGSGGREQRCAAASSSELSPNTSSQANPGAEGLR